MSGIKWATAARYASGERTVGDCVDSDSGDLCGYLYLIELNTSPVCEATRPSTYRVGHISDNTIVASQTRLNAYRASHHIVTALLCPVWGLREFNHASWRRCVTSFRVTSRVPVTL